MDDPRSFHCVRASVRLWAHVCTCTHFRCRLIDVGRAGPHAPSQSSFGSNVLPPLHPVPFFRPSPIFRHLISSFAQLASFARYRLLPSFPHLSIRFPLRINVVNCLWWRYRRITLLGERRRNEVYTIVRKTRICIKEDSTVRNQLRDLIFLYDVNKYCIRK